MEHVPAHAEGLGDLGGGVGDGRAVWAGQGARADDQGRSLGGLQHLGEARAGLGQGGQGGGGLTEVVEVIGQVGGLADEADLQSPGQPAAAQAGVQDRRLETGVGSHQEDRVGLFQPGDGGVEQPGLPRPRPQGHAVLTAVGVGRAEGPEQVEGRLQGLRVLQVPGDGADAPRSGGGQAASGQGQGLSPGRRAQAAILANIGGVEALAGQTVDGEAGLVGDPLLVDVLVDARKHPQNRRAAAVDADGGAHGVHHVDGLGLLQLPGPGVEGVGLGGQGADRAQVDDVPRQLRGDGAAQIGRDFNIFAARDEADLRHAGDFADEAHAAGALDAPGHDRIDQRTHGLFLDGPLVQRKAAVVAAIAHGLVLQVALPALVADRAVQGVVDEEELHYPLAGLLHHRRIGEDLLVVGGRQGAGGLGLGRPGLHLDQAHPAVARDGQALVVAEPRDLLPGQLRHLQNRHAGLELDLDAVDLGFRHGSAHSAACRDAPCTCGRPAR